MPIARTTEVDSLGVINLIGANLIDRYPPGSILKELLQNADDAGAKRVVVGWAPGLPGEPKHQLLRGPALLVMNDGEFKADDAHAICRFGQNYKFGEKAVIGKFGLGLKSVFHLCEAFFYLSSTKPAGADEGGLFNNLASPWVNTEYHRGWNAVDDDDLGLLRRFLEPIWRDLDPNWFSLWLPLRRLEYSTAESFPGKKYGDSVGECPPDLAAALTLSGIARTIPLLRNVSSVQIWNPWGAGALKPVAEIRLGDNPARSLFVDYVKHLEAIEARDGQAISFETFSPLRDRRTRGRYTVETSDVSTSAEYVIVQSWCEELMALTREDGWPKSFVLGRGQYPDKAQPHAAVVLARRAAHRVGGLDVATAVFLPLEGPKVGPAAGATPEFQLTLHGCFFVDSGRRHAIHDGDDIRGRWNRQLWTNGVLPLIVPAVAELAAAMADDPAAVRTLTECLATANRNPNDEQTIYDANRAHVCRAGEWLYRWTPAGGGWQRIERKDGGHFHEIPDFGEDPTLPGRAMPRLSGLPGAVVLTPSGWPRLTAVDPLPWTDELLGFVLAIEHPRQLFEDGGAGLKYLVQFLDSDSVRPDGPAAQAGLRSTLRRVFTLASPTELDVYRETLRQLVGSVSAEARRSLPLGGNWPADARRRVCGRAGEVVIVPDGYEPDRSPGRAVLGTDHAVPILAILAGAMSPGRNTNPAAAVLGAAADRPAVIAAAADLSLWAVQRLESGTTETVVRSLNDLRGIPPVVRGPVTDDIRDMAAAVAGGLAVLPPETAGVLVGDLELLGNDLPGLIRHLNTAPSLSPPAARVPLLQRILANRPPLDRRPNWRHAARYLLHGLADLPSGTRLYLGGAATGVWARLARAALDTVGEPGRVLPPGGLTELLNDPNLDDLDIGRLDPDCVGRLLAEVGPDRIEVQFTPSERDDVLRGLWNYPAVIRGLPLHDAADGSGMRRIGADCFWESRFAPGESLRPHVTLLRLNEDEGLAANQRKTCTTAFDQKATLELALKLGPAKHWHVMLAAIQTAGSLAPELRVQLESAAWLPRPDGEPVAPRDVLHDDAFGDEAASALRSVSPVPGDPLPSASLAREVRQHPGFKELARQLFPDRKRALGRLAGVLGRDVRFRVGNLDLRSPDQLADWLVAFRYAPADVMAVRELVGSAVAADRELCVSYLLPALRDGDVLPARVERVLGHLRDRHASENGQARQQIHRVHNAYLGLAATDRAAFRDMLPRLLLMNQVGEWADPAGLCAGATGLDPAQSLHPEQDDILRGAVACQPTREVKVPTETGPRPVGDHLVAEWHASAGKLVKYFDSWRQADEQVAEWVGAFVAILGDFEPIRSLATSCLRNRMSPELVRANAGIGSRDRLDPNGRRVHDSREEMMRQQRFFVEVTPVRATIEARNLMGTAFPARPRNRAEDLLIGYGIRRSELFLEGDLQVHHVNLREIDVRKADPVELRRMIEATADRLLREVYSQTNASLVPVLDVLSGEQSSDVRVAQAEILHAAGHYLRQFGVGAHAGLRAVLVKYAEADHRWAEEEEARANQKELDGIKAEERAKIARQELRHLFEHDSAARDAVLTGVRHKLADNRYHPRSVLFELFQNADDAYAELGDKVGRVFVVEAGSDGITVMHDGRRINHPGPAGPGTAGHARDLRKMLSLGHSDKGFGPSAVAVTGRFGLGFKSVFLVTDRPLVVSGRLAFEVLGAVYPKPLGQTDAETLRGRLAAGGMPTATATAFRLPPRPDSDQADVTEPFRQLAHVLVVFARRIRQIRYTAAPAAVDDVTWAETEIATGGAARVSTGPLRPAATDCGPRRAVVVRTPSGDILFGLKADGFVAFPDDTPTVWVTAPTTERHATGYLVNAPLDLDVGRSQVTWDSTANTERLSHLGRAAGVALVALFDAGTGALDLTVSSGELWASFWDTVSRNSKRSELHEQLMWGESGAARRLFTSRPALPTRLTAGGYADPTTLGEVQHAVTGVLDTEPAFAVVSEWNSFRVAFPMRTVVSDKHVGSRLRTRPAEVRMVEAVRAELAVPFIDPPRAARLGRFLTRERLRGWDVRGSEGEEVRSVLREARFRNGRGVWNEPSGMLASAADGEESLRAAFAPAERLLSDDYGREIEFFLACRQRMTANLETLADWVLDAASEETQGAALRYLERGELGQQVRRELHRRGIAGTWLEELSSEQLVAAGLNERERRVLEADLEMPPESASSPDRTQPQLSAPEVFSRIAEWWKRHHTSRLKAYDADIYPDGRPRITDDVAASRKEWLKLFITGIIQTIGNVTTDQNREFVRLCDQQGWLNTLLDAKHGSRGWLQQVEDYIDKQGGERVPYFHWLRNFLGVATVARHLDAYAEAFLAINRFQNPFTMRSLLTTKSSVEFQFGGVEAPPLSPVLGIGAHFVLRELARFGLVTRKETFPFCYPPVGRLRRFLEKIGCPQKPNDSKEEQSRSIYTFILEHHPTDPTFNGAFDIPLMVYAAEFQ